MAEILTYPPELQIETDLKFEQIAEYCDQGEEALSIWDRLDIGSLLFEMFLALLDYL